MVDCELVMYLDYVWNFMERIYVQIGDSITVGFFLHTYFSRTILKKVLANPRNLFESLILWEFSYLWNTQSATGPGLRLGEKNGIRALSIHTLECDIC